MLQSAQKPTKQSRIQSITERSVFLKLLCKEKHSQRGKAKKTQTSQNVRGKIYAACEKKRIKFMNFVLCGIEWCHCVFVLAMRRSSGINKQKMFKNTPKIELNFLSVFTGLRFFNLSAVHFWHQNKTILNPISSRIKIKSRICMLSLFTM